jgi:PRTRC genetic system protein C
MARIFIYEGKKYEDPDPKMSVDDVRRSLVDFFPELSNADVKETKKGDDTTYTFSKRVGTKG